MATFLSLDLATWWFLVIGGLITGYGVLDGFDLGAGALHLFFNKEESRRTALNAIGPVWDGNEVWLVIAGGALFAGFPLVYGVILSTFYIPFMLFLVALIFRAISIEFRSKEPMRWWRKLWDISYMASSTFITLLLGLILGNLIQGLPFNEKHEFTGTLLTFFNPYAILIAVTTLSLFMMHGAIYLTMKTENRLYAKLTVLVNNCSKFFILCFIMTSMATLIYIPHMTQEFKRYPVLFALPLAAVLTVLNLKRNIDSRKYFTAFVFSSITTAILLILFAIGLFPNIIISSTNPAWNISIYQAAASETSLRIMLIIAAIGTPLVLAYTLFVFWTFRGKVKLNEMSY
ncbi:cytochrome d ubiquinol oxidase subunit II [Chitinophaga japonensis]|uniref:Cytochrome d ubiquinol oxidase subunit II n=1 Tax=Chitinophaga japonensis TaxID=104662 RepID=A0A562TCL9_CHIJA|nr:cytochrome d ubiquinol oxidase subunit II [Chitinophaga japonensis]TWI91307.1 cytochrome d ubiquinol oxidase subunit II [Chitinophaga japonensis]